MTIPILKILYEFWIIDSYDITKVNKHNIFKENKNLVSIKKVIEEHPTKEEPQKEEELFPDLNLPGINEDTKVNINGINYIK